MNLQDCHERQQDKRRGGSEPGARKEQQQCGLGVTHAARRSCPWVGMELGLLKVLHAARPQQQEWYLEQ